MSAAPSPAPAAEPSTACAFALGAAVAVAATVAVWFAGLLAPELGGYLLGGTALALVAGAVAVWLQGRFLAVTGLVGAALAGRLQALLAAAFGVKLLALLGAVVALQQAGVKFAATIVFCGTFAAASLLSQLTAAIALNRALGRRPASRSPAAVPSPHPRDPS